MSERVPGPSSFVREGSPKVKIAHGPGESGTVESWRSDRSKGLSEPGTLIASSLGASMVATKKRVGDKAVKAPTPKEVEENLKRANLPKEQSAKYHPYYRGKIEIVPRVPVRSFNDFAIWYTPGVAQPCLDIAAWHDDQQGTATINVAGLINALKVVGKKMADVTITLVGAGASNIRTAKLLIEAGAKPEHLILVDSKGIVCRHREDVEVAANEYAEKWELALITNGGDREGGIADAMRDADGTIAASRHGPGVIQKDWVASMADDSILFVIANPVPEIWPWEAAEAGARVIATGRSDFPNQVNNSLGFPGIFRGTLDVRARTITDEMCIAAAEELAKVAEEKGLDETHIVPTMDEIEVFAREATAVALKAMQQGIARETKTRDTLYEGALEMIRRAREETKSLMQEGFIRPPPP